MASTAVSMLDIRGQQDDERIGIALLDALQHRQAIAVRQPIVEQHEVDAIRALGEGAGSRVRFQNPVARLGQSFGEGIADEGFVIDNENSGRLHRA